MNGEKYMKRLVVFILIGLLLCGCAPKVEPECACEIDWDEKVTVNFDTWNENTESLNKLKEYVEDVTDKTSEHFIPVEDRIAVFDMDGTLYGEKAPIYIEWLMFVHRVYDDETFVADDEMKEVADKIIAAENGSIPEELEEEHALQNARAYAGMTIGEYTDYVKNYVDRPAQGFKNITYADMWYKPMLEVVDYLNQNDFEVYICSGTDRYMCRALAEGKVNIAQNHIIGMDVFVEASGQEGHDGLDYEYVKDDIVVRTDQFLLKNVKANKVSQIMQEIGRKPVLSFGNSTGDTSMARFVCDDNPYYSMAFMVVADDVVRENGNLEKAESIRNRWNEHGFVSISMADDWKTIYGENVTK